MRKVIIWFFATAAALILILGLVQDAKAQELPDDYYEDPMESEKIEAAIGWHTLDSVTLTAYCNCPVCCGQWSGGPTYSGVMPQSGHTIAVDPAVIPIGAWVEIDGQLYHAEDTGNFCGKHIDIFSIATRKLWHLAAGRRG